MNADEYSGQRAVIYARISRDKTGEGLGVERQELACRRYAEAQEMQVVDVLVDNDISGFSKKTRPAFNRLQELIEERSIDAVIYWRADRITRNLVEFHTLLEKLEPQGSGDPGVSLHTAEGPVDLATAGGGFSASVMAAVAQYESAHRRDRMKARQRQKALSNEWLGGARPFGWNIVNKHLEVNEAEARALQQAAKDMLSGKSLHSIVRDLNNPERPGGRFKSTLGNDISVQSLKQMLTRTRNVGETVVDFRDGQGPIVLTNEPIMDRETFENIKAFLNSPSRRKSKSNKSKYLLSGVAQCHCGAITRLALVTGRPPKDGSKPPQHAIYRCTATGKGHAYKRVEYVDTVVELFVFRALLEDMHARGNQPQAIEEVNRLRTEWETLHNRKAQAGTMFAEGTMDTEQLANFNQSINQQLKEIEGQLESLEQPIDAGALGDIAQSLRQHQKNDSAFRAWRRSTLDDRKAWLRARFHVVLRPHSKGSTRTFDTDAVSVYPRRLGNIGKNLTAEEVQQLPITPIADEGPPPSMHNLYSTEGEQITETWGEYLNMFAQASGLGWPDGFNIDNSVSDRRADWSGHWKEPGR